jgi:hypothetical protein
MTETVARLSLPLHSSAITIALLPLLANRALAYGGHRGGHGGKWNCRSGVKNFIDVIPDGFRQSSHTVARDYGRLLKNGENVHAPVTGIWPRMSWSLEMPAHKQVMS